jgi:DNA-directed RNA polymerase subunit RPC12/RpoP
MARTIKCPQCGETDNIRGAETPDGIRITCAECGQSWLRDEQPERCATCGSTDLVKRPHALTQYSRGTQLSIVGIAETMLCAHCDARMVEWSDGRAVPANYRSRAAEKCDDDEDERGPVMITP